MKFTSMKQNVQFKLLADVPLTCVISFKVLHHLDTTANGENFPVMEATLREANRVLRTNGTMFIADALPTAVTEVPWMSRLDKALTERYSKHFPNLEQYDAMLERSSFKMVSKLTILGSELIKNYYDPEGPLKKEWRDGISAYALATDKEIRDLEMKVRKMNEDDTMMQFIKANDKTSQIGLITILTCLSQ